VLVQLMRVDVSDIGLFCAYTGLFYYFLAHTHTLCRHKRALHTRKRALYIHNEALYIRKRALWIHKRALNLIHQPISAGPALPSDTNTHITPSCKSPTHAQKSPLYPQKSPMNSRKSHIYAQKSPIFDRWIYINWTSTIFGHTHPHYAATKEPYIRAKEA